MDRSRSAKPGRWVMRQPDTWRRIWRWFRCVPVLALVGAALLAGCGGDFEFKTSGDRTSEENDGPSEFNNPDAAGLGGASTASDERMRSIQEQYQAKLKAESGQRQAKGMPL